MFSLAEKVWENTEVLIFNKYREGLEKKLLMRLSETVIEKLIL